MSKSRNKPAVAPAGAAPVTTKQERQAQLLTKAAILKEIEQAAVTSDNQRLIFLGQQLAAHVQKGQ